LSIDGRVCTWRAVRAICGRIVSIEIPVAGVITSSPTYFLEYSNFTLSDYPKGGLDDGLAGLGGYENKPRKQGY
jgi:hypothetical protein